MADSFLSFSASATGTVYTVPIANPNTATTSDDVETNVQIKGTKLPDVFGKTKDD